MIQLRNSIHQGGPLNIKLEREMDNKVDNSPYPPSQHMAPFSLGTLAVVQMSAI